MRANSINSQRGYVLLLVVLMFMGIGGVVLAGFTQQARDELDEQRYARNQRVLEQAKQALLMFAYNYPQSNNRGPGRLPCPDHDDDGFVDFPLVCDTVGRFPWRDPRLNIQQTVDASGETLWYAVSDSFDNEAGSIVNSDTAGSITLIDQSGGILYDGAAAGIAAVIIAPGPVVKRDEDANGTYEFTQLRATGAQQIDPRNYLDTFNGFDNSVFTNDESDTNDDGFILGPVYDNAENKIVVNDQIMIVTADEVIAMAEKAVLEAYKLALDVYELNVPVTAGFYGNPWLNAYDDTTDLDIYDAQPGRTMGRVPFLNYYTDHDAQHDVITDLQIGFDITLTYTAMADNNDGFDPTYIDVFGPLFTGFPAGPQSVDISGANVSFGKITFDGLTDDNGDDVGTLISQTGATATVTTPVSNTVDRYFWDGDGGLLPQNGWELCPFVAGDGTDCALNPAGTAFVAFTDWNNHADIRVRLVRLSLEVDPDFVVELDYNPAPTINYDSAPTGAANARFTATYTAAGVTDMSVVDAVETNIRNFIDLTVVTCDQDNNVASGLNLYDLGNEDAGTVLCALDLVTNASYTLNNQFVITADYYPEVPLWVADNEWDDSVMMIYTPEYRPGGTGACSLEDGDTGTGMADDCLVMTNLGGANNNIISLLVMAGEHDLLDGDDLNDDGDYVDVNEVAPDNDFLNDLYDIFEPENYSGIGAEPVPENDPAPGTDTGLDLVFDKREDVVPGNAADTLFIIDQL